MLDLVSIGNISIDVFFRGKSFPAEDGRFQLAVGGKYTAEELYQGVGGGGANVAIGLRQYGLEVAVLGIVGDNSFKEVILDALHKANVHTHLCQIKPDYLNISSILLTPSGERSIVHYQPLNDDLMSDLRDWKGIVDTEAIYLGNLPDVPLLQRIKLLEYAKQNGLKTFVNLGVKDVRRPREEIEKLLIHADVIIENGHEFADLVKKKYEKMKYKKDVIAKEPFFKDKLVVVTDSAKGSYAYAEGKVYYKEAIEPEQILDTTGAGDGYTAGFIATYLRSKNIQEAMRQGAERAAKVLAQIGAS